MKLKLIKQTGILHIKLMISAVLMIILVLWIKDLTKSNNDIFNMIIGIIIIITILILPFLKNFKAIGLIDLKKDRLTLNYDKDNHPQQIQFNDSSFDYIKLKYMGFDGEHPISALIFGGIFNRYNGVNNYIELSIDKKILSYEIYIKDNKDYKNLISLMRSIKKTGKNVYLDKEE